MVKFSPISFSTLKLGRLANLDDIKILRKGNPIILNILVEKDKVVDHGITYSFQVNRLVLWAFIYAVLFVTHESPGRSILPF